MGKRGNGDGASAMKWTMVQVRGERRMFFGDTSNHDQISKIKTGIFEQKNITVPASGEISERERYVHTIFCAQAKIFERLYFTHFRALSFDIILIVTLM